MIVSSSILYACLIILVIEKLLFGKSANWNGTNPNKCHIIMILKFLKRKLNLWYKLFPLIPNHISVSIKIITTLCRCSRHINGVILVPSVRNCIVITCWEKRGNVANCVWNCRGGWGCARSLRRPVCTTNMSEWSSKIFTAEGLRDFLNAQRRGEKYTLFFSSQKQVDKPAAEAPVRSGNIRGSFCIKIVLH